MNFVFNRELLVIKLDSLNNFPISEYKITKLKKSNLFNLLLIFFTPPNISDIKTMENYEFEINLVEEISYYIDVKGNNKNNKKY